MISKTLATTLLAVLASSSIACSSDPVDDILTAPLYVPPNGELSAGRVVVPGGRALGFVAQPMGKGETLKQRIRLEAIDPSIAEVLPTVEMNQFVLVGVSIGRTELRVIDENGRGAPPRLEAEVVAP